MITVHHVLKDGSKVKDVTGHVIKADEHSVLYEVINRINKKEEDNETSITW